MITGVCPGFMRGSRRSTTISPSPLRFGICTTTMWRLLSDAAFCRSRRISSTVANVKSVSLTLTKCCFFSNIILFNLNRAGKKVLKDEMIKPFYFTDTCHVEFPKYLVVDLNGNRKDDVLCFNFVQE